MPCWADKISSTYFLRFPSRDEALLGAIEKLHVTVSCGRVSELKSVPELYDIEMGYEIPVEEFFEARPRLGSAAVKLSDWSNVIGIHMPVDADAKSCFNVNARAEGRNGAMVEWTGSQLGLP